MEKFETESKTYYNDYTEALFAYEVYFQILVTLQVDKDGNKIIQFGIRAVPLKTNLIDFQLNLHISSSGKTIGQDTLRIQNHDGSNYLIKGNYDFFPSEQFKIVFGDIKITEYDEKEYETLNFNIALPSKNIYEESGIVTGVVSDVTPLSLLTGDYKWYANLSPSKPNSQGKGSSIYCYSSYVKILIDFVFLSY